MSSLPHATPAILAIETSSELASCALTRGGQLLVRESNGVRTHSQSILPMVQELLAEAGIGIADCDAIAFGAGPGSFTGVRTACGIAQGLAFGADLPVLPLVTLAAMAQAAWRARGATDVLAILDARMGEVYWAQYRLVDGAWIALAEPALCAPGQVAPLAADGLLACGNGISAYPDAFADRSWAADGLPEVMPHARELAQLALPALAAGRTVGAAEAQPVYLRNKVAYTSLERQQINADKAAGAASKAAAA